jgi:hypothetical protein
VPFFPQTLPILEEVLPSTARLIGVFESAGFQWVASTIVTQAIAPDWEAYADKLATGSDSVLARLSEAELASGIACVRAHAGAGPIIEPIDVLFFRSTSGLA